MLKKFPSYIATCLQSVEHSMRPESDGFLVMELAAITEALRKPPHGTHHPALHFLKAAHLQDRQLHLPSLI